MTTNRIRVRRIYDEATDDDGVRVLVDRIWPRGIRKDAAAIDQWAKDVAPSTALRKWYGHDPDKFDEFSRRYCDELAQSPAAEVFEQLKHRARHEQLTLLTATKDVEHSQAAVLAGVLVPR